MLQYKYRHVVEIFVESNKVGRSIEGVSKNLAWFYKKEAPVITTVDVYLRKFLDTKIGDMHAESLKEYLRNDLEDAKKSLQTYTRTKNSLENYISFMSSNFGLFDFLKRAGVNRDEIKAFQEDVESYWDATYGNLFCRIKLIKNDLESLREILQKEIDVLENIPNNNYVTAWKYHEGFTEMFGQERDLFWKIVKESDISAKEMSKAEKMAMAAKKKLKQTAAAHLRILKSGIVKDITESETKVQKAAAICIFLFKALDVYFNYKKVLYKLVKVSFIDKLLSKFNRDKEFTKAKKREKVVDLVMGVAGKITETGAKQLATI